ncbi:MAG: hypothetical protein HeimC2_27560 [Candidatus Heimdallarchaeota archaeon LC_2]|nr:MAG: hypothetical protein HeimC2_27560 [Candidatus Heimdallarchaeota archaeon LC_2]
MIGKSFAVLGYMKYGYKLVPTVIELLLSICVVYLFYDHRTIFGKKLNLLKLKILLTNSLKFNEWLLHSLNYIYKAYWELIKRSHILDYDHFLYTFSNIKEKDYFTFCNPISDVTITFPFLFLHNNGSIEIGSVPLERCFLLLLILLGSTKTVFP